MIGSTIEATLTLMTDASSESDSPAGFLKKYKEELREFLTVSELTT